jgi:hypothetical protein
MEQSFSAIALGMSRHHPGKPMIFSQCYQSRITPGAGSRFPVKGSIGGFLIKLEVPMPSHLRDLLGVGRRIRSHLMVAVGNG